MPLSLAKTRCRDDQAGPGNARLDGNVGWRSAVDQTEIPPRANQSARCRDDNARKMAAPGTRGGVGATTPWSASLCFLPSHPWSASLTLPPPQLPDLGLRPPAPRHSAESCHCPSKHDIYCLEEHPRTRAQSTDFADGLLTTKAHSRAIAHRATWPAKCHQHRDDIPKTV